MTSLPSIVSPLFETFNLTGLGLNLGKVYIGEENEDPQSNPKEVFWDIGGTDTATQPLSVVGGYVYNAGVPARFYTSGAFSIRVLDKDDVLVFYLASVPNLVSTADPGAWPFPMALTQPTDVTPTASQWLGGISIPFAMQLPPDLLNCEGWAFTAPSGGSYIMTLRLNSTDEDASTGEAIATLTWADGVHTPVGATTGHVTIDLPANSRLDWYGQASTSTGINGLKWLWIGYVQGDGTGAYAGLATETELTAAVAELQAQIDALTTSIGLIQGYDVGDVKRFAGPSANLPSGWLALLDDAPSPVLIATYPALYAKIGTSWGGDGLTTFGLPPAGRYDRGAVTGTYAVGSLLGFATESHNHGNGMAFTTGSTVPATYGTSSTDAPGGVHQTVHTDNNAPEVQGYTSTGTVVAGTGTGTPAGTFDTETRPVTAIFTWAIWTGG